MELKMGTYQHYKGKKYQVVAVAIHSESLEKMVVYRALYGDGEYWVRPLSMFSENVKIGDSCCLRFTYLEP